MVDGRFTDFRWKSGAWDLESDAFKKDGKTNWDLVSIMSPCNAFVPTSARSGDALQWPQWCGHAIWLVLKCMCT